MGNWTHHLPVVTVERSSVPKQHVTLIVPYYENRLFLSDQLGDFWWNYPEHIREKLSIILVDDGSPQYPAGDVVATFGPGASRGLRVFRIEQDVRWNWLAARNIGAKEARPGWLLLTDMDHVVPAYTLEVCIYGVHRTDTIYGFSRREHTGETINPHPNSWFMTKDMYWKWGGYDEALSGLYGTDGDARRRMAETAKMAILTDPLVRYEYVGDSSTTHYKRKQPEDARVSQIVRARGKNWRPKTLSFPYHEVTQQSQEVA